MLVVSWTGRGASSTRSASGPQKGALTGPNLTDRGKNGSKIHLITDRNGLPLSLGISGANMHDSLGLQPLVRGISPIRSRCGPRRRCPAKLHADPYTTALLVDYGTATRAIAGTVQGTSRLVCYGEGVPGDTDCAYRTKHRPARG
ncbi:hypothetical protein GCM10010384_67960 [Streptomyces djakartensis]|uniref:Transposase IS4-like domain-containing protein n=1 Tax=Streptomyces djakartensis TaxID=68193 RepID=A0ABQ3AKU8_9ACTN|nr:hypothetical protein GCM10010384_67960 [Streptomyces djakartensis]